MACFHVFNGKEFATEKELNEYLLSNYFGVGFQKASRDEIVSAVKSSQDKILFFNENAYDEAQKYADKMGLTLNINEKSKKKSLEHKYFFVDGSNMIEAISVTSEIDIRYPNTYGKIKGEGLLAQKVGTEFHEVSEKVIQNKGVVDKSLTGFKKKWAERVSELYKEWTADGSTVLSEFKILNTYSKIAGTVDVAVISPTGTVRLFDFKFSRHTYDNPEKKRGNSVQLRAYEKMLSLGEESIGMPKIEIEDASIIHIKLDIGGESENDLDDPSLGFVLEDVQTQEDPISYRDKDVFGSIIGISETIANSMVTSKEADIKLRMKIKGPDKKHAPDYSGLQFITGIEDTSALNAKLIIERRASQKPTRQTIPQYFYFNHKGERVFYKNDDARYDPTEVGKQARYAELEKDLLPMLHMLSIDTASQIANYFHTGSTELFNTVDDSDYDDQTEKQKKIDDILKPYNKYTDRFAKLNSMKGFENVGEDVLIVYRNFDKDTGEYTRIDLMSFNTVPNFNHFQGNKRTTMLGEYMDNFEVKQLAKEIGLPAFTPFENTEKNGKLVKLGMIAMKLKQLNPDLSIGEIIAVPVTNKYNPKDADIHRPVRAPLKQIIEQIRVISEAGRMGKDRTGNPIDIKKLLGDDIFDLITDKELQDFSIYGNTETEFYFEMMARGLSTDNKSEDRQDKKLEDKYDKLPTLFAELIVLPQPGESPDVLRNAIKEIKNDNEKKLRLISLLAERQLQIIKMNRGISEADLENKLEYQFINSAIRELFGMVDDLDKVTDLHWVERNLTSAGLLDVPVVDRFTKIVKERMMNVAMHFVDGMVVNGKFEEGFMKRKQKPIQDLFQSRNKLRRVSAGDDVSVYMGLMAEDWFMVKDQDARLNSPEAASRMKAKGAVWKDGAWRVKRKTGYFWTEETAAKAGKVLTEEEKNFIKWFNDSVKEGYTRTMTDSDAKNFDAFWKEGWIPLMRSNASGIMHKILFDSGEGKSPAKERVKVLMNRIIDKYKNMSEFYDTEVEEMMSLMSVFDKQLLNPAKENLNEYGGTSRLTALGLEENGEGEIVASLDHKDMIENNLEKVITMFQMTSLRKYHMDPLIPLYRAVRNAVSVAEHQYFGKFDGVREYLKVYTENAFLNKRQIPDNELQRKLETIALTVVNGTSAAVIGFNLWSWMKNFEAGYLHTMSNSIAKAMAGEADWPEYRKAMRDVFYQVFYKRGGRFTNKMNSIMWRMQLGDMDVEKLSTYKMYQESGKQAFQSHIANWGNFAGDYLHRAIMVSSQMHVDGSWKAWKQDEKSSEWVYDEDMDPRFEGAKGESLKKAIKDKMRENGRLDVDGKMRVPYTTDQIMTMKKEADLTFQNITSEDQALIRQYGIGSVLTQMQSWLLSRKERWATKGQVTEHMGKFVTYEAVDEKTGEITYKTKWEGHYMEGMYQTLANLRIALMRHVKGKENIAEYWGRMTPIERQNVGRTINDTLISGSLMGGLMLIFGALWDDDEWKKNRTLYYLTIGAVQEVFVLEHLRAFTSKASNPFPSAVIAGRLISAMTSLNPERMWSEGAKYIGPIKLIPMIGEGIEDFKEMAE